MRYLKFLPAMILISSGFFVTTSVGPTAAGASNPGYTCSGGIIPPGTYNSLTVTGKCSVPAGLVTVTGDLKVANFAVLDAASPGPSGVPGTVNVGGNVTVGAYGVLAIGCTPETGCTDTTNDHIGKNLTSVGGLAVIVHGEDITGKVLLDSVGGGRNCDSPSAFKGTSLEGAPAFTDIEDSHIAGNLTITNMRSCFLGVIRNTVAGNVVVNGSVLADSDGNEVVNNEIAGNIACNGNVPAVQFGDSMQPPNDLEGTASGQCASPISSDPD